jgi:CheY-specific phosphatase CheX
MGIDLNINKTLLECVIRGTQAGLSMTGIVPDAVGASKFNSATKDISVIVGLHGNCNGNMTLNFSEHTACFIATKLMGEEELIGLNEDIIDAICEIGNMVAGRFKEELMGTEFQFAAISLPALILGAKYDLYHFKNIITASVTFEIKEISVVHVQDRFFSTTISLLGQSGRVNRL